MAITYGSAAGTIITSFLVTQALGDQSQQTGNNTIVLDDIPSAATGYGGNVGNGTFGIGDGYDTRRIMIGRGSTIQERIVISDVAGTGTTRILTVHEDWDTNPVATTDTVDVYYEVADIEDGGAGGGISFAARTGLWTLTRILTIGNGTDPAGLGMHGGQALECADRSGSDSFLVDNSGFFRFGYYSNGLAISGGIITLTAATDDEPAQDFLSGADCAFLDTLIWAQVATLSQLSNAGASIVYDKTKLLKATQECELYGDTIVDLSISGEAKATEIVRVDASTTCLALILVDVQVLDSVADTATEIINLTGVVFSGVPGFVDVRQNKTWNLIDPVWGVVTYTDLTWTGTSTGNELNDKRSINVVVQESDGTKLQSALVNIYENTQLTDLVVEAITDINGEVSDSFIYKKHATNSVTTTYGGHAAQVGKWLYLPFVAVQVSTSPLSGSIVLSPDNNILQTTQATAITDGSGITWNEDTNPSSVIEFTGGSGGTIGLAVGDTITGGTSTADGIVTQIKSGDGVAGTIHLKTRDANNFTAAETIDNGADGWTATFTTGTQQDFSVWIDGTSKAYQTIYDYIAARQTETTLTADGELFWEWCRSSQSQPLYAAGTSFYTEQSNGKGIIVIDGGAGTVDYFTDDAGATWTPPTSVTLIINVIDESTKLAIQNVQCSFHLKDSPYTSLMNEDTTAAGVASEPYTYTADTDVVWKARKSEDTDNPRYFAKSGIVTIDSGGVTVDVQLKQNIFLD